MATPAPKGSRKDRVEPVTYRVRAPLRPISPLSRWPRGYQLELVTSIGAEFDEALLGKLPAGVDPCAERGEFHTCVTAGPMFSRPLDIECGEVVEREGFIYGDLRLRSDA